MKKVIWGAVLIFMGIGGIGSGSETGDPADFLLGTAFLAAGGLLVASSQGYGLARLIRLATGAEKRDREAALQRRVLEAAAASGGTLTLAQLVMRSHLGLEEAERALMDLASRGVCVLDSDDQGTLTYTFPGLDGAHLPTTRPDSVPADEAGPGAVADLDRHPLDETR